MRHSPVLASLAALVVLCSAAPAPGKEFLTTKEIEQIQDAQEIDQRVKIYLEAAALRLKAAEERLNGVESQPGDPLEFFTVEEMLDGYYSILRSVMANLDSAVESPRTEREKLGSALRNLKGKTESAAKSLKILKRMAEERQKEELWNLVNEALDITQGAHEGAELGLSRNPEKPGKKKRKA